MRRADTATLTAALAVVIAAAAAVVTDRSENDLSEPAGAASPAPPAAVAAARARRETWQRQLTTVGTLAAYRGVEVTAEVPGLVSELHFESGDEVEQGQLLVELSTDTDRARLRTIEAELAQARADFARSRELDERNLIAAAEVEQRRTAVERLEAQAEEQRALLAKKHIAAPFAGRLGLRLVDLGEYVAPGTPLVTLQALAPIDLNFALPEAEYGAVEPGQRVAIDVAAYPSKRFTGEVVAVSPVVDEGTRNFAVQARLANAHRLLRPGMFADVTLELREQLSVVTVPATAISHSPSGDTAFLIREPGAPPPSAPGAPGSGGPAAAEPDASAQPPQPTVTRVPVETGAQRGERIAVTSGLDVGDRVVTAGQLKLFEGAPVAVDPDEPSVAETALRR